MTVWQQWLEHPERLRTRHAFFQFHYWVGMMAAAYVLLMSLTGGVLVYSNQLSKRFSLEWLVRLHSSLLSGPTGRLVNGAGAICLTAICITGAVIWWPGVKHWRRSLTVDWRAHIARIHWDLHSALGLWCFPFVLIWGISGIYFTFPQLFNVLLILDPHDRFSDPALYWLSRLHFGRFGWFTQALWSALALAAAVLALTGIFICCRRVIYKKPSNPKTHVD